MPISYKTCAHASVIYNCPRTHHPSFIKYVTLFFGFFLPPSPCHKLSHFANPPPSSSSSSSLPIQRPFFHAHMGWTAAPTALGSYHKTFLTVPIYRQSQTGLAGEFKQLSVGFVWDEITLAGCPAPYARVSSVSHSQGLHLSRLLRHAGEGVSLPIRVSPGEQSPVRAI